MKSILQMTKSSSCEVTNKRRRPEKPKLIKFTTVDHFGTGKD
eukprot:UN11783